MINRERLIYLFCLGLALSGWVYAASRLQKKPVQRRVVVNTCSGCGTEWHSYEGTRTTPLTKCPNCPMSDEEFEALKEAMKKRLEK